MDREIEIITGAAGELSQSIRLLLARLAQPASVNQLLLLLVIAMLAWGLGRATEPMVRNWLRAREGWPKWRLRWFLVLAQRLVLVWFTALAWLSLGILTELTRFQSRRYLIALAATIATAWLVVAIATRLINNPFLRKLVTWGLWIYVTIYYLGLSGDVAGFLDRVAIEFGDFRLSLLTLIKALAVTGLLVTAARLLTAAGVRRLQANRELSPSMQVLAIKILQLGLYGLAIFIGLKAVGFDLTGLAFLSGAVGVGIGFGLQKVVSNLVSGVIILLDKSVKPGDVISLGDTFGWIEALGARYVSVVTRDGKEYLIPNEDLITGQVVNWSHSNDFVRIDLNFGVSYQDDPHQVRKVAIEAAYTVSRVLSSRPAVCHITNFSESSVDYVLRFWISDPSSGLTNVRGGVYLALWDAFRAHGFTLPFPQREVRILNDGPARAEGGAAEAG